ncbi:tyrosine-type recombinase/integrase [Streptomyces cellulosae]
MLDADEDLAMVGRSSCHSRAASSNAGSVATTAPPPRSAASANRPWPPSRAVQKLFKDLPAEDGVGMYSFRHYFASNALGNGMPITGVAEWMGHNSIEEMYRTYRHLMSGSMAKAARIFGCRLVGSGLIRC